MKKGSIMRGRVIPRPPQARGTRDSAIAPAIRPWPPGRNLAAASHLTYRLLRAASRLSPRPSPTRSRSGTKGVKPLQLLHYCSENLSPGEAA
jgi:hypothetical protein